MVFQPGSKTRSEPYEGVRFSVNPVNETGKDRVSNALRFRTELIEPDDSPVREQLYWEVNLPISQRIAASSPRLAERFW
jgi:hypothetical protein